MGGWRFADIHHLGMTVSNIERSIEFYQNVLGLTLVGRRPLVEEGYVSRQTGHAGVRLSVASFRVQPESRQSLEVVEYLNHTGPSADTATNRPGSTHLCLIVDDLMAAYADLKSRGVTFKSEPVEITAGPNRGGRVVYFSDPDGYVIEIFEPVQGD